MFTVPSPKCRSMSRTRAFRIFPSLLSLSMAIAMLLKKQKPQQLPAEA